MSIEQIAGIDGFRFKFHKMINFPECFGENISLRCCLLFGEDVFVDINGDNCQFVMKISGKRCKNNIWKMIGKGKRDLLLNLRIVID